MLDINIPLIIAQLITFLAGLFLLWLVAYKPIMGVFRQRADKIKQDLDAAETTRLKMEAERDRYTAELAKLTEQGRQIV
jgi:F0F1-type ATP synthase membrane subunit b/b'